MGPMTRLTIITVAARDSPHCNDAEKKCLPYQDL